MNTKIKFSHKTKEPESSFLYIVGTPIGNLEDFSPRALKILKNVSLILCEDTRQTKKIMNKFGLKNTLMSFNKHNSLKKIPGIISELKAGKSIALVSDAGMPSICDPGEDLIKQSKLCGIRMICVPGPSAVLTALVASGHPSSKFTFQGFVPRKKSERERLFFEISNDDKTNILFESPHRLKKFLIELKEYCGGEREIHVSRELTKIFEEHIGNNIDEVINYFENKEVIGEITIVIKGALKKKYSLELNTVELKKELNDLINSGLSLSAASKYLAKRHKISKSIIYNLN